MSSHANVSVQVFQQFVHKHEQISPKSERMGHVQDHGKGQLSRRTECLTVQWGDHSDFS